jgi:arylsulfatase
MNRGCLTVALCAVLTLTGCAPDPGQRDLDPRPNILLITLDTLRADYLGCYGSPDVETPNIDRLAGEGVQFMRAVAPSQCTNPSHASIMTGLYLAEHGVYDNSTPLADEAVTLAELLGAEGYETIAAVSARHLNPKNSNFGQGFQTFLRCGPTEMAAGKRNRKLFRAIGSAAHRPFFAWVHYFDPHGDYDPPDPFHTRYPVADRFDPVASRPWMDLSEKRLRQGQVDPDEVVALYKGEVSYLDSEIGRLLGLLEEKGLQGQTLVVLVADHGESMTEKDIHFCHAGLYNQVLHVPLLLRWPGRLAPGLRVETPVSPVDILPTLLQLLDLPAPDHLSGASLVPVMEDPGRRLDRPLFSEAVGGVIRSVHLDGYKFIKAYPGKDWSVTEDHLYRPFGDDYREEQDLLSIDPQRAELMDRLLTRWLDAAAGRALPSRQREKLDRETEEALRQLGYLE